MSTRLAGGEEDAPDDSLDLQHHLKPEEEVLDTSRDSSIETDHIEDQSSREDEISEVEAHNRLLQRRIQHANPQVMEETYSADETSSVPDDTPSIQSSILSSLQSSAQPVPSPGSRTGSIAARRAFDTRFQSRLSTYPLTAPHPKSLTVLGAISRQTSVASSGFQNLRGADSPSAPWDVIRWTKLHKLASQAFSEAGRRNFGRPTCLAVSTSIVIGTSKGTILVFNYQQDLKRIIGPGTRAVECGPVTSLAISEDSTTIAAGHAEGNIFTWELAKSTRPVLHLSPLDPRPAQSRKGDGHLAGASVIHIGFLGFRHTAIVSADDRGMAFSHLATRGMGSISRSVRTTRVLGRYPDIIQRAQEKRKPSSVLALSNLPFGNVEQATSTLGLVAMMTPYLLVIVSTIPIAQTQYKAARPKEIAAHSAMTAALAWFPAIKLKTQGATVSRPKLVYCWSNVLTVLEVIEGEPSEPVGKGEPLELAFNARSRWRSEEAISAVQWLNRSVLAVLTITQQLIIVEDLSMNATDSFDLVQKQIYHYDIFSQQLHSLVEQLDEEDSSMHGVVADAFYMSFRAYKGRLFLLGFNGVSLGSLSNWADRLLAMLEIGDFIGAIRLATSYHSGIGEKVTIGLPEDDQTRHEVVKEKLVDMMVASLKYAFGHNQQAGTGQLDVPQLQDLATACVEAALSIGDIRFLFDEVFVWYDDHDKGTIFLNILEPYILDGQLSSIPPIALRPLIDHYMTTHSPTRLEEIICRLDTSTMDIDQVTGLCRRYSLYDAFIYVWTGALGDFVSPIEELMKLYRASALPDGPIAESHQAKENAMKIFPYLSFTLTSRIYPTGQEANGQESDKAKEQIYAFFFSAATDHASSQSSGPKPSQSFPHLRELLLFDAASTMSVFNEAFEDNYLNRPDELTNGFDQEAPSKETSRSTVFTRQFIITVLLEVMSSTSLKPEDSIYIDIFIARSLPKYPQDLFLSGSTLDQILTRICRFSDHDLAEDCQLSVEYLLSVYRPADIQLFVPLLKEARFFRVLKSVYISEYQWPSLVRTYFLDENDREGVFGVVRRCLGKSSSVSPMQQEEVRDIVKRHALDLMKIDIDQTAIVVADFLPQSHELFLSSLGDDPYLQYRYLHSLFEPRERTPVLGASSAPLLGRYIQLMCRQDSLHVADYVDSLRDVDLQLGEVLTSVEDAGIVDAAVILMARQGQVQDAVNRLAKHLSSLETALMGILHSAADSPDAASTNETVTDLLESIKKYSKIGIWLCQRQTKAIQRSRPVNWSSRRSMSAAPSLSFEESLWLQLINSVVSIATNFSRPRFAECAGADAIVVECNGVASSLRTVVQDVFTALIRVATSSREDSGDHGHFSFLRIMRSFLSQAATSSPSLAELRAVISSIFSAYAYEESLLDLSSSMLDRDLFVHVDEVAKLRRRGWRPRGLVCGVCRRRVWGPGAGTQIWEAWWHSREQKLHQRQGLEHLAEDGDVSASRGKGKATMEASAPGSLQAQIADGAHSSVKDGLGPAVVFACRHLFHQVCLDQETDRPSVTGTGPDNTPLLRPHTGRMCPVCSNGAGSGP